MPFHDSSLISVERSTTKQEAGLTFQKNSLLFPRSVQKLLLTLAACGLVRGWIGRQATVLQVVN